jgi:hypothetical protein
VRLRFFASPAPPSFLTTIWHVYHLDGGHHLEQLAVDMGRAPLPPDAMLSLPGFAFA